MRWGYGMGWRGLMVWWCLVSVFDGLSGGVVVWCVVELRVHEKCARIVVHISGPNQSAKGCFFWCRLVGFLMVDLMLTKPYYLWHLHYSGYYSGHYSGHYSVHYSGTLVLVVGVTKLVGRRHTNVY